MPHLHRRGTEELLLLHDVADASLPSGGFRQETGKGCVSFNGVETRLPETRELERGANAEGEGGVWPPETRELDRGAEPPEASR